MVASAALPVHFVGEVASSSRIQSPPPPHRCRGTVSLNDDYQRYRRRCGGMLHESNRHDLHLRRRLAGNR